MAIIAIFSASFCSGEEVAEKTADSLKYRLLQQEPIKEAAERFSVSEEKMLRALNGAPSFFNNLLHERERHVIQLRSVLAEMIQKDNLVILGPTMHLLPRYISHVLKVCLVANKDYRVETAVNSFNMRPKDAEKQISADDEEAGEATNFFFGSSPWDSKLYDIVIPMHSNSVEDAVKLICEHAAKENVQTNETSRKTAIDFALSGQINLALVREGYYYCDVAADDVDVTIMINKSVIRLEKLENDLTRIAEKVEGVKNVHTRVGPKFNQANISFKIDLGVPSRVLLVDDEKDFALTLSERLQMRDINSSVVHDGDEALSYVKSEEPDVMVLDLRMPGIDGIEVLRRMKREHPKVEVIILTGHGTEKDKSLALELGAFAFLQKPVDVDVLAKTMKDAYRKIGQDTKNR
jgi:two-component system, OmpR family, response regulator CpxR